jgi:hypothetical protein
LGRGLIRGLADSQSIAKSPRAGPSWPSGLSSRLSPFCPTGRSVTTPATRSGKRRTCTLKCLRRGLRALFCRSVREIKARRACCGLRKLRTDIPPQQGGVQGVGLSSLCRWEKLGRRLSPSGDTYTYISTQRDVDAEAVPGNKAKGTESLAVPAIKNRATPAIYFSLLSPAQRARTNYRDLI